MSEWKEYKLGEAADISTGYAFKGDEYEFKGKLRVVRGENVTIGNLRWDSEKFWNNNTDALQLYFLQEKDIVIGMDGSRVGHNRAKIKVQELPLILAQRVARLRAKDIFDQDFIWYHIFSDSFKDYVEAIHTGTSIPHISQKQIADFEIKAPSSKTEQTAIASILSSLDDKIDLLHRQNATLEKMAETLFRQWFVEEAKEEWEEGKLSYFADFFNGKSRPNELGTIPIYGGNGILGYTNKSNYFGKSIIVGRVGAYCGSLYYENKEIWVSDNALLVKPKFDNTTHFLFYLMKTLDLNSMAEGSSHPLLTQTLLKSIEILIPPIQKVNEFDKLVEDIRIKIDSNNNQIRTLTSMRDSLLPKLMSGEVRVVSELRLSEHDLKRL